MGSWNRRALQFFNAVLAQIAYKIGGGNIGNMIVVNEFKFFFGLLKFIK